jgi:hypothetical protein
VESGKFQGSEYAIAETTGDGFESSELEHSEYFRWLSEECNFSRHPGFSLGVSLMCCRLEPESVSLSRECEHGHGGDYL